MKNTNNWREPKLICLNTEELMCKIKVRASSLCNGGSYTSECPELTTGETWCNTSNPGDDGGAGIQCGILTQCVEVGPLFGCDYSAACSTLFPVLK